MNWPRIPDAGSGPRLRRWPVFACGSLVLLVVFPLLPRPYSSEGVVLAAMGGWWALAFYLDRDRQTQAKFAQDLIQGFNARYERQCNNLQWLVRQEGALTEEQELLLVEYFNLCSEEWLARTAGYVDDRVWEAWLNGMRQFGADPRVATVWERERQTRSYYGFEFPTG